MDEVIGDILIGGHAMGGHRIFRNVQVNDRFAPSSTTSSRSIRGRCVVWRSSASAVAFVDVDPPVKFMRHEVIRVTPTWISSWGYDPGHREQQIRRS